MLILGIETSCDETAVALVRDGREVVADLISSQVELHRPYGGVVPELASRRHLENLPPLLDACLEEAGCAWDEIDAVAVTRGPGLIGALLVGVSAAKGIALARGLPLVGVHHIEAHLHSIELEGPLERPYLAFVVSGGHTELYLVPEKAPRRLLARTRDDAAGEAYDKVGKILGLGYPAGPVIDRLATGYEGEAARLSVARMSDESLDLSFSGLKTEVLRLVESGEVEPWRGGEPPEAPEEVSANLLGTLAGFQRAVSDQLLDRAERAREAWGPVAGFALCGGVSANGHLRERAGQWATDRGLAFRVPALRLSTDNAVMIAALGHEMLVEGRRDELELTAEADLPLEVAVSSPPEELPPP